MTVNTTSIISGPYTGNDTLDEYSYTFRVEDKSELKVWETPLGGTKTLLTVDTDYTVNNIGTDGGGTITRIAGNLPTGSVWYIRANYPDTQLIEFGSQGAFFPDIHEAMADKLTFLVQQIDELQSRAVHLSESEALIANPELPTPVASKLIAWASDALSLVNADFIDNVFVQQESTPATDGSVLLWLKASTGVFSVLDPSTPTWQAIITFPIVDTTAVVKNAADPTKLLRLNAADITTATTRVATMPDRDIRMANDAFMIGSQGILAQHEGLALYNNNAFQVTITATSVLLKDSSGESFLAESVNENANITLSGAGGLDTGSEASSTWYHVWLIARPDNTVESMFSTSSTAPTMPGAYTYKGYVGAIYNDSGSDFDTIYQNNHRVASVKQSVLSSGTATSYTSVDLSTTIPTTASSVYADGNVNDSGSGTSTLFVVCDGTNELGEVRIQNSGGTANGIFNQFSVVIRTIQTLFYKVQASPDSAGISVTGWRY